LHNLALEIDPDCDHEVAVELTLAEAHQETRLPHSAIAEDEEFDSMVEFIRLGLVLLHHDVRLKPASPSRQAHT
jgi:hypothetical protein